MFSQESECRKGEDSLIASVGVALQHFAHKPPAHLALDMSSKILIGAALAGTWAFTVPSAPRTAAPGLRGASARSARSSSSSSSASAVGVGGAVVAAAVAGARRFRGGWKL